MSSMNFEGDGQRAMVEEGRRKAGWGRGGSCRQCVKRVYARAAKRRVEASLDSTPFSLLISCPKRRKEKGWEQSKESKKKSGGGRKGKEVKGSRGERRKGSGKREKVGDGRGETRGQEKEGAREGKGEERTEGKVWKG